MHEKWDWGVFFLSPFSPTALPEGEETNSDTCAGNSEGKKEGRTGRHRSPEIGKAITRSDGMCAWLKN